MKPLLRWTIVALIVAIVIVALSIAAYGAISWLGFGPLARHRGDDAEATRGWRGTASASLA